MRSADVMVAGAGPIGLLSAHLLSRAGMSVEIVDTGMWPCAHSYALALHPKTVDILCQAGVAQGMLDSGTPIRTLALYDGRERRTSIHLPNEGGRPMIVLPQSAVESHLEKALDDAGIAVRWRHKLMELEPDGDEVRVSLNRYEKESSGYVIARTEWTVAKTWTMNVPFVVGADGYNSAVRRSAGISFPEVAPCTWYAVFEFLSNAEVQDEVRIALGENTCDVLWPLGNGLFRWGFELPDHSSGSDRLSAYRQRMGEPAERVKDRTFHSAGDIEALTDEDLERLIAQRAPWFNGSIEGTGWRTLVRFERRLAESFGSGRCWLAGDSAHLGSPIGVHSLNVGCAEAQALTHALAEVHRYGHFEPLEAYNDLYVTEWRRLFGIDRQVQRAENVDPWVWENRDRVLPCLPAHGEELSQLAGQLGLVV